MVELRGADEGEVHAERAVDARAVDADEDAVRHRGPRGVLAPAVEAYLRERGIQKVILIVNDEKCVHFMPPRLCPIKN